MKFKDTYKGAAIIMVSITAIVLATYSSWNKEITINIDGQTSKIDTISRTVEGVLSSKKISLKEGSRLEPSLDTRIKNNMEIKIVNQFKINIDDGGEQAEYITNHDTVEEVLESCNIVLGEMDILNKDLKDKVQKDEIIKITRVKEELVVESEEIPYTTETIKDKKLIQGKTEVETEGKKGEKEITYKIVYKDNKPVSREKVSEKITKKPTKEIIKEGALEAHSI